MNWRPVVFASRSMIDIEQRYAQIEEEAMPFYFLCCSLDVEKCSAG